MVQRINVLAPYQSSIKCIKEYDSKCKKCFDWLDEVLEQARKTLSLPEQYLLPKTPCQNRKRQRCPLPVISENKETDGSPSLIKSCEIKNDQVSLVEHSVASDIRNCPIIRQSKRIASQEAAKTENFHSKTRRHKHSELDNNQVDTLLKKSYLETMSESSSVEHSVVNDTGNCHIVRPSKRIASQETSETEDIYPRTRRQKRLQLDDGLVDTSVKESNLKTISNSSTVITETSQREEEKRNIEKNDVSKSQVLTKPSYKTRPKKLQLETTTKVNKVTEKKGVKRMKTEDFSETPNKTASNKVATTPSVKHRVKAYEENIKLANTPKISQYSNINSAPSPKKTLIQDNIKCTKIDMHSDKCALLPHQDCFRNLQLNLTKRLSRLSETRCRSSLLRYQLTACKIKTKRSSTVYKRKSKRSASLDNNTTDCAKKSKDETPPIITRKSDKDVTPINVLEKMQSPRIKKVTGMMIKLDDTPKDENYSDISMPSNSTPMAPLTAPANKIRKLEVSSLPKIGKTFTPCVSAISTGKLRQNYISRISKVPRTPQQGLSYLNQSSVISRVLNLREHMQPKEREKYLHEEIKKKQKREEEVLRKKESLLKARVEEKKRKREARMHKVSETRTRLLQEKDRKRILEITKEERAAQKGAELKERKLQILQKKQMTRKQKLAEIEERRKKEECRLQKIKEQKEIQELEKQKLQLSKEKQKIMQVHTPTSQTCIQKQAMYNSYISKAMKDKDILVNSEEKENQPEKAGQILNTTYEKKNENCESYEMTPARTKTPSPSDSTDNYGIDDIKSGDETDDEHAPKKKVPAWAQGIMLRTSLLQQACNPPDVDVIFGNIDPPDLTEIFSVQRKRFQKRTSSAVWHTRSFLTP